MAYFGKYNYTLDAANRIIVPSRFREALGVEAVFFKAEDGCLYLYDTPEFQRVIAPLKPLSRTNEGRQQLRLVMERVIAVSVDRNGRLVIPADCVEHASLKSEVTILGADNRIEVWDKDLYSKAMAGMETAELPDIQF